MRADMSTSESLCAFRCSMPTAPELYWFRGVRLLHVVVACASTQAIKETSQAVSQVANRVSTMWLECSQYEETTVLGRPSTLSPCLFNGETNNSGSGMPDMGGFQIIERTKENP